MHVDRTTRNLAIANLVAQIGIIITGGLVRLTGSGLGCSQWPLCEPGQFTPQFREESSIHPYIEFGNRTLTGVLGIIAVLLIIAVYRRQPTRSRPQMKRLAWWPLIGIIVQAIMSWLNAFNVINTHNDFVRQIWGTLDRMTEPLYRPIRKILPDFGGLDLSPLVVLVGLAIIERVLLEVQYASLGL